MSRKSRYHLAYQPWTWDYFIFQISSRARGADEIVVDLTGAKYSKFQQGDCLRRLSNYIMPGPQLSGLKPATIGREGEPLGDIRQNLLPPEFERLTVPIDCVDYEVHFGSAKFTVTIRDQEHNEHKNSDQEVWRTFAAEIGAHVIEDYRTRPIGLLERFSIYAGAQMNYGVANGPTYTVFFTPYPMCMWADPVTTRKSFSGHGIQPGDKLPWLLDNHALVWERPSVKGLLDWHRAHFR